MLQEHTQDQSTTQSEKTDAGRNRSIQKGYSAVLLKDGVKKELKTFRRDRGLIDSHMERGLVTAAVRLLLSHPELHTQWLQQLAAEAQDDVLSLAKVG
jgi:hypothetical protein